MTPTKPEDALVEQVARALCKSHRLDPGKPIATMLAERTATPQWSAFAIHARAVIEASGITTLLERERRYAQALERLGSNETMTVPFVRGNGLEGEELLARIEYARAALTGEGDSGFR